MAQFIPITLVGDNLGARHRFLKSLVNDAYTQKIVFESIRHLQKMSAVDELFKIDLASRYRHVDYIIETLQHPDMLYVSRALKCTWLLESRYSDIINPSYLEETLFPKMTTTAVNKTRHWIHLHLKDTKRCEVFFEYYSSKNLDLAFKFLWNCSAEFIRTQTVKRLDKITPQRFKLICEKCPEVVRIYFDNLPKNPVLIYNYYFNRERYHDSLKCLLKVSPDLFFDITEKYFDRDYLSAFNSATTEYIVKNHRNRFDNKPELYTAWFLDIEALAKCLNSSEIKDIVLKLARAKYLSSWFSYKNVEPLIKRLSVEERNAFKKQIFVDKSFGDEVEEWPYPIPLPLSLHTEHVFSISDSDALYENDAPKSLMCSMALCGGSRIKRKTLLDQLFDRYRFISFEKTLFELRKQLTAESSSQNREYMMLVLVSKSGGHSECVEKLLKLLVTQHKNEPANLRAAVLRSLVKRTAPWRLQDSTWHMLLEFARGLGLDGREPEAPCWEGLHAVVLRDILLTGKCQPAVFAAFMRNFSTLTEYKLSSLEKLQVIDRLPALLLVASETEPKEAATCLGALVRLLDTYRVRADKYPGVISAITAQYKRDPSSCVDILQKLYDNRIARKTLFRENFPLIQTNASYLNVLRHDIQLLETVDKSKALAHDGFLQKIAIYFAEDKGLAERYVDVLDKEVNKKARVELARPIAFLAGGSILSRLQEVDKMPADKTHRRFVARLRANIHLSRPKFDAKNVSWRVIGAKAVANRVLYCKSVCVPENMRKLLSWSRTYKLAFWLSPRSKQEVETFSFIVSQKPTVAVKAAFKLLRSRGNYIDPCLWDVVKYTLKNTNLSRSSLENIAFSLIHNESIPPAIQADCFSAIFEALKENERRYILLNSIMKHLPRLDENIVKKIVLDFMDKKLNVKELSKDEYIRSAIPVQIIAKFLLLCTNKAAQERRFELVGKPFLNAIETIWKVSDQKIKRNLTKYLNILIDAFNYTKVFFDTSYVSCMPVFEKVVEWMKNVMPVPEHFAIYSKIHLTMLYFKAIRQSVKNEPEIFSDKDKRENEGVQIVGTVFGKYLAHEVMVLTENYFESIITLYAKCIRNFFSNLKYSKSRDELMYSTAKGILKGNSDSKCILLIIKSFLDDEHGTLYEDNTRTKIIQNLKRVDNKETKFFLWV